MSKAYALSHLDFSKGVRDAYTLKPLRRALNQVVDSSVARCHGEQPGRRSSDSSSVVERDKKSSGKH